VLGQVGEGPGDALQQAEAGHGDERPGQKHSLGRDVEAADIDDRALGRGLDRGAADPDAGPDDDADLQGDVPGEHPARPQPGQDADAADEDEGGDRAGEPGGAGDQREPAVRGDQRLGGGIGELRALARADVPGAGRDRRPGESGGHPQRGENRDRDHEVAQMAHTVTPISAGIAVFAARWYLPGFPSGTKSALHMARPVFGRASAASTVRLAR
jgi:hypothetical protein